MSFLLSPLRRSAAFTVSRRTFSTTSPSHLARMTIVGRMGSDPEMVDTAKGQQIIRYNIATSHGPKENRQTSWFRCASFTQEGSPQREYIMGLQKGTLVYLEGDATMRTYEDADGKTQNALNVVSTKIEVLKRPQPKEMENVEGAVQNE